MISKIAVVIGVVSAFYSPMTVFGDDVASKTTVPSLDDMTITVKVKEAFAEDTLVKATSPLF